MVDLPKRQLILVLEDEAVWQTIIIGVCDNEGVDCEIVPTIAEFTESFKKGRYKAVILDNRVKDGAALERNNTAPEKPNLAEWVRKEDSVVWIALNSNSSFFKLSEAVRAWDIRKDPMELRNFLREIK